MQQAIDKTFEESLQKLERIVKDLEQGQLPLAESLAQFSEATKHLQFCYGELASAQRKIELLKGIHPDGSVEKQVLEDIRIDASEQATNPKPRKSSKG